MQTPWPSVIPAPPPTKNPVKATDPPAAMSPHERARIRAAAHHARRVFPGPVGEWLFRELLTWDEFGYRLGSHQLVMRVVDDVLTRPAAATGQPAPAPTCPACALSGVCGCVNAGPRVTC